MFDTGAKKEDDEDDDGAVEAEDEAPIYAEGGNDKVVFKQGVTIQKSPYSKIFDVSRLGVINICVATSAKVQDCCAQRQTSQT